MLLFILIISLSVLSIFVLLYINLRKSKHIDILKNEIRSHEHRNIELTSRLENEKNLGEERLKSFKDAEVKMREAFESLASRALKNNTSSFLDLAEERLQKEKESQKNELKMREKAIETLTTPLKEALSALNLKMDSIEKDRIGAYSQLKQYLDSLKLSQQDLQNETRNLTQALRSPTTRGRWGEMQLRRVVEMSGMLAHCDFTEQTSKTNNEGVRFRPDMVVNLPGEKNIVIDAKTPLNSYLSALDAEDEITRRLKLKEHAKHVRQHIQALSMKSYWEQFQPAPEFVVMFLPGEPFFSAALEQDPTLIEYGAESRVILATPTTLISLLRTIAYGWKQEQLAQNAQEISKLGDELYKRLSDMGGHMSRLGRNLSSTVDSYNQAVGSMERRVLITARKLRDMGGIGSQKEIPTLTEVDKIPRNIQMLDRED